ncbi:MAG: CCA tRNA nucleotidyltransferase [Planctomycetota bacterium]|jgi:poly(A) polymerase
MHDKSSTAWKAAMLVLEKIRERKHVAYFAGGCVRDALLSIKPKDYDVATDATPDQVLEMFPRARRVGAKFGVVLVRRMRHDVEVATFRSDGDYSDGRRPDHVEFGSEQEDARRRDFTINALFYDPKTDQVLDYVNGRNDLEERIVRTVGNPDMRFGEDHLRLLRAIRFATRLGFEIEDKTWKSLCEHAPLLSRISPERIWMELEAILVAPTRARAWDLLSRSNLVAQLSPERNWPGQDTAEANDSRLRRIGKRLAALGEQPIVPQLALAAIWCDESRDRIVTLAEHLRLSNRMTDSTRWLVRSLPRARHSGNLELADVKELMAPPDWVHLPALLRASLIADGLDTAAATTLHSRAAAIPRNAVKPAPFIDGHRLQELGVAPGPAFGRILRAVYRAQLNEDITTEAAAVDLALSLSRSESG